jgi:hypothetical protein
MAGDSGGVFGSAVAVGEGGALTLDKNSARRSTRKGLAATLERRTEELTLLALVSFHRKFLSQVGLLLRAGTPLSGGREKCFETGRVKTLSGGWSVRLA